MREIQTATEINATPERVWQLLTAFDQYPQWNPFIRSIKGDLKPDAKLEVSIKPPESRPMTFRPRLLKVEANRELRWLGRVLLPGLFDGEHIFTIEPLAANQVRFRQCETFTGMLVPLLWRSLDKNTRRGFQEMNAALKRLAETTNSGQWSVVSGQ